MGGSIGVTIVSSDEMVANGWDRQYRMTRWTNSLPEMCYRLGFDPDEDVMSDYMEEWFKMRDDWERNKDTGDFEYLMTSAYFPSAGLAPVEYGLVVIDFQNRTVTDIQGYSHLESIPTTLTVSISIEANPVELPNRKLDFWNSRCREWEADWHRWIADGAVRCEIWQTKETGKIESLEQAIAVSRGQSVRFILDHPGWTFGKLDESVEGWEKFKQLLLDNHFELSDEENAVWDEYIQDRREWEEE